MCCRFWLLKPFPFERFSDLWSSCPRSPAGLGFWIRAWCFPSLLIGNHQTWRRFFWYVKFMNNINVSNKNLAHQPATWHIYLPIYLSISLLSINPSIYLPISLSLYIYVYSWISIYIYIHICAHTWGLQLLYCSYVGPLQIHVDLPDLIEAEHKTAKHSSEDGISWYILFCFYVTGGEIIIAWHA